MIVAAPLDLDCGTCGAGKAYVGTAYNVSLAATSGQGPYTYSVISGSLPPGLTLSSSGVISGTPTTAGNYTFTAKVVDKAGSSDTATCTINVLASPVNLDCSACGGARQRSALLSANSYR